MTPQVTLINTMSNERLDVAGVRAKFGVPPERIVDYLTLVGDAVDNIPGVAKVGPKTAAKWIDEHGSLEGVMAAAHTIKGVAGENLRAVLDWLPTGRKLVTVRTDCELTEHLAGWPALDALALQPIDGPALLEFYGRYGFKTLRRDLETRLQAGAAPVPTLPPSEQAEPIERCFETVLTPEALESWIDRITAAELTAIDTETDSLDAMQAQLIGISLSTAPGHAAYIPIGHGYAGAPEQLSQSFVLERMRKWLEDPLAAKIGQNVKYDLHVFANVGIAVQGYCHDTMLQSYVLEAHRPHGLESLADRHLGRKGLSYNDLCGKGAQQIPFAQVDIERASDYCCEDSEMCLHVHRTLWPQLESNSAMRDLYQRIEMPVALLLQRIERAGVLVDPAVLAAAEPAAGRAHRRARAGGVRTRRSTLQHGLAQADRRHPVRHTLGCRCARRRHRAHRPPMRTC